MRRKTPCQYCKQRRRKCERESELDPCQRCIRMNKECIPLDQEYEIQDSNQDDLSAAYEQVQELENQIELLQVELDKHKQRRREEEPLWVIKSVNGELQLTTQIKSIQEFMQYGHSLFRYLSPFGNAFGSTLLEFQQTHPTFIQVATSLIMKYQRNIPPYNDHTLLSNELSINDSKRKRLLMIMGVLIDNFFRCHNDYCPLLHEDSYRTHFNTLKDPLTDATTLAICASVAIARCKHTIFNMNERTYLGEFFYKKCMDILLDIFDDKDRALESLIVINLLQHYLLSTGLFKESRKWATISFLISGDLKLENEGYDKGGDHLPAATRIKYAIIHRNCILSECLLSIMDYILDNKQEDVKYRDVYLDTLPDESQRSKDMIEVINHVFKFVLCPAFVAVMQQTRKMGGGDSAALCLEQIIRYEDTLKEWWQGLPDELKMCPQPYDMTSDVISGTNDLKKLMIATFINTTSVSVQGVMLLPKMGNGDSLNIHNILKDKATHLAMQLIENGLALAKKMDEIETFCYAPGRLMVHSLDSLLTLVEENSETMTPKLREYLDSFQSYERRDEQFGDDSPFFIMTEADDFTVEQYIFPHDKFLMDMIETVIQQRLSNLDLNV